MELKKTIIAKSNNGCVGENKKDMHDSSNLPKLSEILGETEQTADDEESEEDSGSESEETESTENDNDEEADDGQKESEVKKTATNREIELKKMPAKTNGQPDQFPGNMPLRVLITYKKEQLRDFRPEIKAHLRRTKPKSTKIYPGCYQLPHITEQLYNQLQEQFPSFSAIVSESAFAYYCAVIVLQRILMLRKFNRAPMTKEELNYAANVKKLNLRIPILLQDYIAAFGNVEFHNGHNFEKFLFCTDPINYVASNDGSPGWFGRVGPDTQHLYQKYPCLSVYAKRIVEDFKYSEDNKSWNLPEDIAPEEQNAGSPTENLLGYVPRKPYKMNQIAFLAECGVTERKFSTSNTEFLLNQTLLRGINLELIKLKQLKLFSSSIKSSAGSVAQLPYHVNVGIQNENTGRIELDGPFLQYSKYRHPNALHVAALRFQYQMECNVNEKQNIWCVYDFNEFKEVPEAWREKMIQENEKLLKNANCHTNLADWEALSAVIFDIGGKNFHKSNKENIPKKYRNNVGSKKGPSNHVQAPINDNCSQ